MPVMGLPALIDVFFAFVHAAISHRANEAVLPGSVVAASAVELFVKQILSVVVIVSCYGLMVQVRVKVMQVVVLVRIWTFAWHRMSVLRLYKIIQKVRVHILE